MVGRSDLPRVEQSVEKKVAKKDVSSVGLMVAKKVDSKAHQSAERKVGQWAG